MGRSVILLDRHGPANSRASSGGETRIIRMGYGSDELYTRFAQRSLPQWTALSRRARQPLFQRTGMLWLCRADQNYPAQTHKTLTKLRIGCERLSRTELKERYPQFFPEDVDWGLLEPGSGVLLARRAVQALVAELVEGRVKYENDTALPVAARNGRVELVPRRSGDELRADTYVFACGPWLPELFPNLLRNRIFPTRQEVFFFGSPDGYAFRAPNMPAWFHIADEVYGLPDIESRGPKIAFDRHGLPFDPETGNRIVSPESVQEMRDYVSKRLPALAGAPIVESRVCQYENTSNGDFLIDRHPQMENVWLVGGGSGHGFKHGPAVGEYLAKRIAGQAPAESRFLLESKAEAQKRTVF
jgi:glycine/D-amino acid oxidase-like deaminating enzyme